MISAPQPQSQTHLNVINGAGLGIMTPSSTISSPGKPTRIPTSTGGITTSNLAPGSNPSGSPVSTSRAAAVSAESIDLQSALSRAGGDPMTALYQVLGERNNLAAQNGQLWKLLEKQRERVILIKAERDQERQRRGGNQSTPGARNGSPFSASPSASASASASASPSASASTLASSSSASFAASASVSATSSPSLSMDEVNNSRPRPPGSSHNGLGAVGNNARALFVDIPATQAPAIRLNSSDAEREEQSRLTIGGDIRENRDQDRTPVAHNITIPGASRDENSMHVRHRPELASLLPSAPIVSPTVPPASGNGPQQERERPKERGNEAEKEREREKERETDPLRQKRRELESRMSFEPEVKQYLSAMATPEGTPKSDIFPPVPGILSTVSMSAAERETGAAVAATPAAASAAAPTPVPVPDLAPQQVAVVQSKDQSVRGHQVDQQSPQGFLQPDPKDLDAQVNSARQGQEVHLEQTGAPLSTPPMETSQKPSPKSVDPPRTRHDPPPPVQASPSQLPPAPSRTPPAQSQTVPNLTSRSLPFVSCAIPSSSMVAASSSKGVPCLTVQVTLKPPQTGHTYTWTLTKAFPAFIELDERTKALIGSKKGIKQAGIASLPDSKGWKDYAPIKVDQRKAALETYLQSVLRAAIEDKSPLATFLTTDIVAETKKAEDNDPQSGLKTGYLTKKGKNFRGWKSRFFVLNGPLLNYYDQRGGDLLGTIPLVGAKIGTQNKDSGTDASDDKAYRHAFLILEGKRPGGGAPTKHVLCAESDNERDAWVRILVKHVSGEFVSQLSSQRSNTQEEVDSRPRAPELPRSSTTSSVASEATKGANFRQNSRDDVQIVRSSAQPINSMTKDSSNSKLFSAGVNPSLINTREEANQRRAEYASLSNEPDSIKPSGVQDVNANQQLSTESKTPDDRSPVMSADSYGSAWPAVSHRNQNLQNMAAAPKRKNSANNNTSPDLPGPSERGSPENPATREKLSQGPNIVPNPKSGGNLPPVESAVRERERKARSMRIWGFGGKSSSAAVVPRNVFGVPLEDSLSIAKVEELPAIVYRTIRYLETKKAHQEEGIFRMSGSTAVVKSLKYRFNSEGDFDLLANDERWDLHAIAGLLKMFLRELPVSILTKELQMEFVKGNENSERVQRIPELARLVTELPEANFCLLRALTRYLTLVVGNSNQNKMTLRNIGIVFSPSLGIPAGLFSDLICYFRYIFEGNLDELEVMAAADAEQQRASPVVSNAPSSFQLPASPSRKDLPDESAENEGLRMAAMKNNRRSHIYTKTPLGFNGMPSFQEEEKGAHSS